jgi:hypothetical protein
MTEIPELKTEHLALRRAYRTLFLSPDAERVMADLYKKFNGTTIRVVDGRMDTHASDAAAGAREVLLYIEFMMREKNATTN